MVVIAVQAALLLFRQYHNPGFGGLYGSRHLIYLLCILVPSLMASLAFVNPKTGYVSLGAFCYLPSEPIWYRLSLALIPRGVVFSVILALHSAIYIHTMRSLKEFKRVDAHSAQKFLEHKQGGTIHDSYQDPMEFITSCITIEPREEPTAEQSTKTSLPETSSYDVDRSPFAYNLTGSTGSRVFESEGVLSSVSNVSQKRDEIQRQVGLLLIYPLVYLGVWIFPMICQGVEYSKAYGAGNVPFWMALLWGTMLAAQPGIEALVVLAKERLWRKEKVPLPDLTRFPKRWRRTQTSTRTLG